MPTVPGSQRRGRQGAADSRPLTGWVLLWIGAILSLLCVCGLASSNEWLAPRESGALLHAAARLFPLLSLPAGVLMLGGAAVVLAAPPDQLRRRRAGLIAGAAGFGYLALVLTAIALTFHLSGDPGAQNTGLRAGMLVLPCVVTAGIIAVRAFALGRDSGA